jgi:hypothetical protein
MVRVPLYTRERIDSIITDMGLSPNPVLPSQQERNLAYHIYLAVSSKKSRNFEASAIRYPFLAEVASKKLSIEQIRGMSQKLHSLDVSIAAITLDLMTSCDEKYRERILSTGCRTDHLLAKTKSNRRPLYIEYLLHAVSNIIEY